MKNNDFQDIENLFSSDVISELDNLAKSQGAIGRSLLKLLFMKYVLDRDADVPVEVQEIVNQLEQIALEQKIQSMQAREGVVGKILSMAGLNPAMALPPSTPNSFLPESTN